MVIFVIFKKIISSMRVPLLGGKDIDCSNMRYTIFKFGIHCIRRLGNKWGNIFMINVDGN